ncbi:MAG: hypothetical protein WC565_00520 [Parcubacteria group bacterium]
MSLLSLINAGNIALVAALLVVSFFKSPFVKGIIILAIALFVKFRSGFDVTNIVFLASLILGTILEEKLPFARGLNVFLSIVISFAIMNAYLFLS